MDTCELTEDAVVGSSRSTSLDNAVTERQVGAFSQPSANETAAPASTAPKPYVWLNW